MTAIERCKWTNIDEQIDEGAAAVACDEPAIGQSCVFNGPACAKHKCRCTPKAPPPPAAPDVEAAGVAYDAEGWLCRKHGRGPASALGCDECDAADNPGALLERTYGDDDLRALAARLVAELRAAREAIREQAAELAESRVGFDRMAAMVDIGAQQVALAGRIACPDHATLLAIAEAAETMVRGADDDGDGGSTVGTHELGVLRALLAERSK